MKKWLFAFVLFLMVGCTTEIQSGVNDLDQQQYGAKQTLLAVGNERTQIARQTQKVLDANAQATADAQNATMAAQQATSAAATLQMYNAQVQLTLSAATSTAAYVATSAANTQVAVNAQWSNATATAGVANQIAAVQEQERIDEYNRRKSSAFMRTYFWYFVGSAILFIAMIVTFELVRARTVKWRTIPRDLRGDAPLLDKGSVVIDMDRVPNGVAQVHNGKVTSPDIASQPFQEKTTALDQAVDMKSRGLPQAQPLYPPSGTSPPLTDNNAYQVTERRPSTIPEDVVPILDAEWRYVDD